MPFPGRRGLTPRHGHTQRAPCPERCWTRLTRLCFSPSSSLPYALPRRVILSQVDGSFFKQLAYLLRIAFGGRNAGQGAPLLAAQLLLLLMRTQITVKTTKMNVYYLTKVLCERKRERERHEGREKLARDLYMRHARESRTHGIDIPFPPIRL